ncbi:MAG TPA: hypothetical protein VK886_02980 [Vicinamibacterales bacterium]|nr:hypothetical protein [Vicinamibacterales bacterium]
MHAVLQFPPLAGICSRADAQRTADSVERCTAVLHRLAYAAQRMSILSAGWLPSTPEWELKQALALHGWMHAQHAAWLYARIAEMREPPPGMHDVPDARLEAAFDEAAVASSTIDRVSVLYGVLRRAQGDAIAAYLGRSHPLADQPSHRILLMIQQDHEALGEWADRALAVVRNAGADARIEEHVADWVEAAGGIDGRATPGGRTPKRTAPDRYKADILPRRDARFTGLFDTSTPADVVYLDQKRTARERNAALMFKRVREMDVPEVIAGVIAERWMTARNNVRDGAAADGLDWDCYVGMARQMWDEARHAMLGETLLEHHGVDWRRLPINVTFSYKLARYCSAIERHILLYAIEQSLMPRNTGKPYELQVANESGDALSTLFHDFDWADEVLHVEIARRCLKPELPGGLSEARQRADTLWQRIAEALDRDPMPLHDGPAGDWWTLYVRKVTGQNPAPVSATHVKDWRPTA